MFHTSRNKNGTRYISSQKTTIPYYIHDILVLFPRYISTQSRQDLEKFHSQRRRRRSHGNSIENKLRESHLHNILSLFSSILLSRVTYIILYTAFCTFVSSILRRCAIPNTGASNSPILEINGFSVGNNVIATLPPISRYNQQSVARSRL